MKSIAFKLWTGMMVLVGVVLVLLWLFQVVFLEKFYTGIRISEVQSAGQELAQSLGGVGEQDIQKKMDELAQKHNISIELVNKNGEITNTANGAESSLPVPMMRNNIRVDAFNDALNGKVSLYSMTHPRMNSKFTLIALPVRISNQIQEVMLITMPMAPVNDTAVILKKQLYYITAILLMISIILSYFISRLFTKPILKITAVSEQIASGNLSATISLNNKDEIGTLAATINKMGYELTKIEQLRKDLIANISHELRTPLSLIRGYAETIKDVTGNNTEKREKQLDIIIEETERLNTIVNDVLNLSQIQAGYSALAVKPCYMNHILERTVKRFEILSEKTQVTLVFENCREVLVLADAMKIEQVLYNLIHNAFNHTPEKGSVKVSANVNNTDVRIEINDTGSGIAEEDLKYIWERFYKADKSGARRNSGTGLGLAIVKGILEAHNFNYGVESKVGQGTTFWFEIPIHIS